MVARWRATGVRTVVWVTPWVNLESLDGQIPPDPGSRRLHREPAPNYEPQRFVRGPDGEPHVARWWMGTGSMVDFTDPESEAWWRAQAVRALRLGVEGIKADDGEGYYVGEDLRFADGTHRARRARGATAACTGARCSARSTRRTARGAACSSGAAAGAASRRPACCGRATRRRTSGRCARWCAATIAAAGSGFSNWSHDVGGYLGHRAASSAARRSCWCAGSSSAASRRSCRPTAGSSRSRGPTTARRSTIYRGYVLLHEMLNPYVRAAAATRGARRAADRPPRLAAGPRRLGGRRRVRLRARRCGSRRSSRRARASARRGCRPASGSRRGRARACAAGARCRRPRRCTRSPCGCARARSSSPIRPRTSRRVGASARATRRCTRRCGASRAAAAPWRGWPTGRVVRWRRGRWSAHGRADVTFSER